MVGVEISGGEVGDSFRRNPRNPIKLRILRLRLLKIRKILAFSTS
jgi:hypothetical protein